MASQDDGSWLARAACAGGDLDLFFSKPPLALEICARCPVRPECLYEALTVELPGARYGVRGGLTAAQRNGLPTLPEQPSEALATLREHLAAMDSLDPQPEGTAHAVNESPAIPPAPPADTEKLPIGQLLKWGNEHADPDIREQAARAFEDLAGLRRRHAAEQELKAITTQAEDLEKRLAELRAREAELAPPKPKKTRARKPVDYPAGEVRAWAKNNGVDCPAVGRVPKAVVDAWRAAQSREAVGADA